MIPDYPIGQTLDFKFSTRAFATGAPTTLAGSPVVSAYPGNSTTELTAGITLSVDFDGVTGLHNVRVVASTGNGYATNTSYALVLTAGTVGGVSVVGETIASFSLDRSSAAVNLGLATNAAATGDPGTAKTGIAYLKQLVNILVGTDGVATFPAEAAPANAVSLAEVIRAIHADVTGLNGAAMRGTDNAALASAYTAARAAFLDNINGHIAQTGDSFARLGAPAGASVSADVAAVKVDTAAVKVKTDQMVFSKTNELDVNTKSINDAEVIGDGNATPWDGA